MKEIGGYIEFEHYHGVEFHSNAIKLNCSRCCLEYLIKLNNIKHIYIPYFLCDTVLQVCKRTNIKFSYYHINEHFLPDLHEVDFAQDWLYVVNYYGQLSNEKILELSKKTKNLIVDNVQSFFQLPILHVSTIYNCRKFFGVADGAYLYSDNVLDEKIEKDISYDRMKFLLGRFEKTANEFYSQYVENNDLFDSEPIKQMSSLTENIMRSLDYERIKNIRTENFLFLHEQLKSNNLLKLTVPEGAFAYPFLIKNGAEVRKKLQSERIYIPTLWPDVFDVCNERDLEYNYAKDILPLPVDQRYDKEDMLYLIKKVLE